MQVNSINNQNINGLIIHPGIKGKLEKDVMKLLKFDTDKMAETAKLIAAAERKRNGIDLRVAVRQGIYEPKTDADFDVFIANMTQNKKTDIPGDSLAEKFLAGLQYISERA